MKIFCVPKELQLLYLLWCHKIKFTYDNSYNLVIVINPDRSYCTISDLENNNIDGLEKIKMLTSVARMVTGDLFWSRKNDLSYFFIFERVKGFAYKKSALITCILLLINNIFLFLDNYVMKPKFIKKKSSISKWILIKKV